MNEAHKKLKSSELTSANLFQMLFPHDLLMDQKEINHSTSVIFSKSSIAIKTGIMVNFVLSYLQHLF